MKIKKKVNGTEVILDYRRVKRYNNRYVLYNVYKVLSKKIGRASCRERV